MPTEMFLRGGEPPDPPHRRLLWERRCLQRAVQTAEKGHQDSSGLSAEQGRQEGVLHCWITVVCV